MSVFVTDDSLHQSHKAIRESITEVNIFIVHLQISLIFQISK